MTATINASTTAGVVITPDNSGNIQLQYNGVAAPAFRVYISSNQTISLNTNTKVQLNTKSFDTANCFDNTTNYRFTPTVTGYYQFSCMLPLVATGVTNGQILLYKNGSNTTNTVYYSPNGSNVNQINATFSDLIYMNGSTDYVELYGYISGTGTLQFGSNPTQAYLAGYLARSA
jgi:hypothetical protein